MGTYQDPMTFQYLGFGRTSPNDAADAALGDPVRRVPRDVLDAGRRVGHHVRRGPERGVTWAVADKDYTCAAGPIPEGTVASVRLGFEGLVDGEPRITTGIIYSMIDTVVDEWLPRDSPRTTRRVGQPRSSSPGPPTSTAIWSFW